MAASHISASPGYSGEHASMGRRHSARQPACFNVTLADLAEREPPVTAFISNVSQRGVCIVLPIALNIGQDVRMQIAQTALFGMVVYSTAEGDFFRTGISVQLPVAGTTGVSELLRTMLTPVDPVVPERTSKAMVRTVSRRHLRYPVSGTLRVLWLDGERGERIFNAKIANASVMGAKLRFDEMMPVGSNLSCDGETLRLRGAASVRYCRFVKGKYEIGLEFAAGSGWRKPENE